MTSDVASGTATAAPAASGVASPWPLLRRLWAGRTLPLLTVISLILVVWLGASVWLNAPQAIAALERADQPVTVTNLVAETWDARRPVLPSPQQVAGELAQSLTMSPFSKRSLVYHAGITGSAALLGFAMGTLLGLLLAVGIVHVRTLDLSLMPWIITSQTIPILAIAPMIVVVLGNLGLTGLLPKAIISMYLGFFPVAIGMVKGLRAPDPLQMDLMRTYSASRWQILRKLRWPAAMPYLFAGLKVAIAISLVGAIVGELPTGARAGLGARLLAGSYFGQTTMMWAALFMAAFLGMALVGLVTLAERATKRAMGGRFA
jgi:NitT/TauT family transport system permease protein